MSKKNFIMTDVMSEYHIPNRKILSVIPFYAQFQGEIEVTGMDISWDNEKTFGHLLVYVNGNNEVELDTVSNDGSFVLSKEFFLDLMSKLYDMASKLYDMAEVK